MNPFQILGIVFCGSQAILSLMRFWRRRSSAQLGAALVWTGATICFIYPDATSRLATQVGVTRGTDLVLYTLSLFFIWAHFQQFSRYKAMQKALTDLVRSSAIRDARAPSSH